MIYGYARVSTKKQKIDRQINNILSNYPTAVIYKEYYTGTKMSRPEYAKLCNKLVAGDILVFDEVSRMSRSAEDGYAEWFRLYEMGVELVFLKEPHISTSSYKKAVESAFGSEVKISSKDAATDTLVNDILASIEKFIRTKIKQDIASSFERAQAEVDYLHQRTREGIRAAKERGSIIGAPPGKSRKSKAGERARIGIPKYCKEFGGSLNDREAAKLIGISRTTLYKYKQEFLYNDSKR